MILKWLKIEAVQKASVVLMVRLGYDFEITQPCNVVFKNKIMVDVHWGTSMYYVSRFWGIFDPPTPSRHQK